MTDTSNKQDSNQAKAAAQALATKRNLHKSKHLNANWEAVHDSIKGWHVALVVTPK